MAGNSAGTARDDRASEVVESVEVVEGVQVVEGVEVRAFHLDDLDSLDYLDSLDVRLDASSTAPS